MNEKLKTFELKMLKCATLTEYLRLNLTFGAPFATMSLLMSHDYPMAAEAD